MSQGQKLLNQLETASGQTEHVVALIFDIRGFTNFCKCEGDSVNIANFVKRIYIKVISEYFPDGAFYKPTGDGMLIVFRCSTGKEGEIANATAQKAVKLVGEFSTLCKGDKLVYFRTPSNIGVGISRGSACCISSNNEIIDYSGKPLNIAARLSDMARPFGVIFDESISSCVPTKELENNFLSDNVYIKGLAEEEPIKVYFTKKTIIPSSFKKPLDEPEWVYDTSSLEVQILEKLTGREYIKTLSKTPLDASQIIFRLTYPTKGTPGSRSSYTWNMNEDPKNIYYLKRGREHLVCFNIPYILSLLKEDKLEPDTLVRIEVMYPVKA